MNLHKLAIGAVALGFTLSAMPVSAGQRPSGDAQPTGTAEPRAAGSSGSAGGGSAASSPAGGSTSSNPGSSGGSDLVSTPRRSETSSERAQRPRGGAERPRGGGGSSSGRAVPRGTAPSGGDSTTSSAGSSDRDSTTSAPRDRAVPVNSRSREGRNVTGRATDRVTPIPSRGGLYDSSSSPYPYGYYLYDPYGYRSYWYPGYALGLGYFYYDPFWYGAYGGYGGYSGYGGYGYQGSSGRSAYYETGSLRLKIKPRDAQVFVDGYFVGTVDSFDGVFQRLTLEAGGRKLEIRAPGYETLQLDVLITPGETVTYKGELIRIQ